jgi:hypothetical protein
MKKYSATLFFLIVILLLSVTGSQTLAQNTVGPFSYYPTNQGGSILGQVQIDGVAAATGDILAAFDPSGECVGAKLVIINSGIAYINLVIYGDDGDGHGMSPGEMFYLKIYDASTDQIIEYGTGLSGWQNTNFAPMPGFNNIIIVYNFVTSSLRVTPTSQNVAVAAGATTFSIASNTSWTVTENVSWFNVSPMSGSNNGTLTVTYDANTSTSSRSAQITVTGTDGSPVVNVTINQSGNTSVLSLSIPVELEIPEGENAMIPVVLSNPVNEAIEAFDIKINFDPSVINVSNVLLTGGVLENQNFNLQYNTNIPGQVTIIMYAGMDLFSGEGEICYLNTSAIGNISDCSDLTFTIAQINEENVAFSNGSICINQAYFEISGNLFYFSNTNPIPGVLLSLSGNNQYTATTTTSGNYSFESVVRDDYVSVPAKNNDLGGLSGTDASRIARFPAGLYTFNCMEQIAADVSLSGNISGLDASRVARYSAGLITELNPGVINWVFSTENISNCPLWPPISWTDSLVYNDLHEDLTSQDFTAIRLGDVTGNWTPDSKFKNEILNQDERKAGYNLSADSIQLLIHLDELLSIEGVDITLEYDASKLKFVKADFESSIFEGSNYEMQVNEGIGGKLKMVIYALGELYFGDGVLTKITFAVISETNKPARVALTNLSVNENRVKGWLVLQNEPSNHQFKTEVLSIIPDEESSFIAVYPNPFQNKTCISYYLNEQSKVTVQITDINGKLVATLANEVQNVGMKELIWNGDNDQKQQFPQGVYFAVFKSDNSFEVKRMVLIR